MLVENNCFNEMVDSRLEFLWCNGINYGEEFNKYRDKVIETFGKLRALVGDGEARKLLFELDSLYCSMAAEEERAMYRQGFLDGVKI